MLRLARIFRDMAASHALYPFVRIFTTKTNLVFGIAMRAASAGDELFAYHFFLRIFFRGGFSHDFLVVKNSGSAKGFTFLLPRTLTQYGSRLKLLPHSD